MALVTYSIYAIRSRLFAFDPRRCALLLIGGDKTGNTRWYDEPQPKADAIYTQHLNELKSE